jgi:hypothetical protein
VRQPRRGTRQEHGPAQRASVTFRLAGERPLIPAWCRATWKKRHAGVARRLASRRFARVVGAGLAYRMALSCERYPVSGHPMRLPECGRRPM